MAIEAEKHKNRTYARPPNRQSPRHQPPQRKRANHPMSSPIPPRETLTLETIKPTKNSKTLGDTHD